MLFAALVLLPVGLAAFLYARPELSGGAATAVARAGLVEAPRYGPFTAGWLTSHPGPDLAIRGQTAVLVDVDSKQILWQRSPHARRAPASLTKLVTAMVAADLASLDHEVTVTEATDMAAAQRVEPQSTVMGLTAGEVLTVRDLMYGLFLRSGNDAAETLGGSIVPRDRFIERMNARAAALGMNQSRFTTPVGLDDSGMWSTSYDLAIAGAAIVTRYPQLLAMSGAASREVPATPKHKAFSMVNYNKMVIPGSPYQYEGATGMKTAFTDEAGPCMVASASRGGRRLVAVILNSANFFADATALFDYGFATRTT